MTIPPLPPRMGHIQPSPYRQCMTPLDTSGTRCPHQARYVVPYLGRGVPCCPFHAGQLALIATGGLSWQELSERAGDE